MSITLKKLRNVSSETCVTIILNTHRTGPDNNKDPLTLKNLIKEAENRLSADFDKKYVQNFTEKFQQLEESIDHKMNLESLILFVSKDIAEYTRLPIKVEDRVVIDNTFHTRDLMRSLHMDKNYYILVLNQQKVRLIEASSDKLVREIGDSIPIENIHFHPTNQKEASFAGRERNSITEYFNRIDKDVNKIRSQHPLPVLISSTEPNYHLYLEVADKKYSIINKFIAQPDADANAGHFVEEAWKLMKDYIVEKNNARKKELLEAVNSGKFYSDVNDIWRAIHRGQVKTLFIEQGLFQPAIVEKDTVSFVSEEERTHKEIIDDIYDEMIEYNLDFGGDVVFLPKGELDKFNGFGAILRY